MQRSSVVHALRTALPAGGDARWTVAFSGGLDSTALLAGLHALTSCRPGQQLRAVHVHHGLQADADAWASHCEAVAAHLGITCEVRHVAVEATGKGIEAAARDARYAALREMLEDGELLFTAHHARDQAETLLLRLMRGAGVHGLAGIPARTRFGRGWLLRPLLALDRAAFAAEARAAELDWIDDPANRDTAFDRNYLRHEVLPRLRARWPGADATIGRTARLAAEAGDIIDAAAAADRAQTERDGRVDVAALRRLSAPRQRGVLRSLLHAHGLTPPGEARLRAGLEQLLSAGADREPRLAWPDGQVRRYRGRLFVLGYDPEACAAALPGEVEWQLPGAIELGGPRGRLRLLADHGPPAARFTVRFRRGGERLPMADGRQHRQLKKLFQAAGVVPWMRAHVPLVMRGDELVAAGDLWRSLDAGALPGAGARLIWDRHGELY